jgi:hypothetical protein
MNAPARVSHRVPGGLSGAGTGASSLETYLALLDVLNAAQLEGDHRVVLPMHTILELEELNHVVPETRDDLLKLIGRVEARVELLLKGV